jgi:hypothetical protein
MEVEEGVTPYIKTVSQAVLRNFMKEHLRIVVDLAKI